MPSQDPQHETAVRYLLGELTESECDELEQAYFTRDGGFEELLAIEEELIDSYVAGELSPAQQRRFESRFPVKDQSEGIEFARVLKAGLRDLPSRSRVRPRPGDRRHLVPYLAPAAALLVLAGAWLGFRVWSRPTGVQNSGGGQPGPTEAPRPTQPQRPVAGAAGDSGRLPRDRGGSLAPDAGATAPKTVRVTLGPGLIRSGGGMMRVVVPPDAQRVVLTLVLDAGTRTSLRAVVQTAAGKELYRRGGLDAHAVGPALAVDVPVPAHLLVAGDYVVVLEGRGPGGRIHDQGEYAFRVTPAE
jgi:hypothetical protein